MAHSNVTAAPGQKTECLFGRVSFSTQPSLLHKKGAKQDAYGFSYLSSVHGKAPLLLPHPNRKSPRPCRYLHRLKKEKTVTKKPASNGAWLGGELESARLILALRTVYEPLWFSSSISHTSSQDTPKIRLRSPP